MKMLTSLIITLTNLAYVSAADFGEIIKNSDGSIKKMNLPTAIKFCHDLGMRLPTNREYLDLTVARGAKGYRQTAYPNLGVNDPQVADEYYKNFDEKYYAFFKIGDEKTNFVRKIDFYFNIHGYEPPDDLAELEDFWTDSVGYSGPDFDGFIFDGKRGGVSRNIYPYGGYAVRCAQ